jgi:hypothetical protein
LRRADADPTIVERIINATEGSRNEYWKAKVYVAYSERTDIDPAIVEKILNATEDFRNDYNNLSVYADYLRNSILHDAGTLARIRAKMKTIQGGPLRLQRIEIERLEQKERFITIKPAKTKKK